MSKNNKLPNCYRELFSKDYKMIVSTSNRESEALTRIDPAINIAR